MTDHVCGDCSILPAGYTCTSCCLYDCRQQRDELLALLAESAVYVPNSTAYSRDLMRRVAKALAKAEGLTAHGS